MSLDRKPINHNGNGVEPGAPRTLRAASNPAQRLQELLRREAEQQARAIQSAPEAPAVEEMSPPTAAAPCPEPPVSVPAPPPVPEPAAVVPPVEAPPRRKEDPVILVVVVNSERQSPVEYASIEDMPTITSLEETYRAFLLSDEWQRRGPVVFRFVRLRRRRR